jgi:predicted metal-dependent peptidase
MFRSRRKPDPLVKDAIELMDESHPFWLSKVLNIGQPVMDESVGTAAIEYDKKSGDFTFRMNPEFAAELSTDERAFLMSHEAMHVMRNDMKLHADERFPDKEALNQAMDAIINDTLSNAGLTAPEWAINGLRDVGYDCDGMDVEDVYETIIENRPPPPPPDPEDSDDEDESDEEQQEGDGEGGGGQSDDKDDDDQDQDESDDEDESDSDDDAEDDADPDEDEDDDQSDDDSDDGGDDGDDDADGGDGDTGGEAESSSSDKPAKGKPMAGGGHDSWDKDMADAAEEHDDQRGDDGLTEGSDGAASKYDPPETKVDVSMLDRFDFEALFRHVEPELVDGFGMGHPAKADWTKPRRNMMSMYPQTIMPSRRDDKRKLALASKRMQLVVFLDNSGSVSGTDVAIFRELARRLPKAKADYIFVAAATWATEVTEDQLFGRDGARMPDVGGGDGDAWEYIRHGRIDGGNPETMAAAEWLHKQRRSSYGIVELDAMHSWIMGALQTGRLREYPKSVLAITDAITFLETATTEQGERWTVLTNPGKHGSYARYGGFRGYRKEILRDYARRGCKIQEDKLHELGDFMLKAEHVVKKARV